MAPNPNLQRLREAGVSIWLDTLSRELLDSGGFAELVRDWGVTGATSNPTIFAKAITGSDRYDGQLRKLTAGGGHDMQELFFALALDTSKPHPARIYDFLLGGGTTTASTSRPLKRFAGGAGGAGDGA